MAYGLKKSALFASASSQSFTASDTVSLSPTGNFTIEAWIKPSATLVAGTAGYAIAMKGDANANATNSYSFYLNSGAANTISAIISNGSTNAGRSVAYTFVADVWFHIAMVYDTGGNVSFYVNGVQQGATQTGFPTSVNDSAGAFRIGSYLQVTEQLFFDGNISLVRLWNTNLSSATLLANACTVFGSAQTGLSAEWSLDNVTTDASGNSNTLSNNNAITFPTDVPSVCLSSGVFNMFRLHA
jgi:hypothetical protein